MIRAHQVRRTIIGPRLLPLVLSICFALLGFYVCAPVHAQCVADCNGDGTVTIDEIIVAVNIALGTTPLADCPTADPGGDGLVTIDELIVAVNQALNGCDTLVTVTGACRQPGATGLVACDAGTGVDLSRCDDRTRCVDGPGGRTFLASGVVGTGGSFSVVVDSREAGSLPLVFEAEVANALVYRIVDFGVVGAGGGAGGTAPPPDVVVDPSSEGAARALVAAGFEQVEDADAAALVDETRAEAARNNAYDGLDPAAAADAGQQIAFGALFIHPDAIAMSPDGTHLYAVDASRDVVAVLARDGRTGEFTPVQMLRDGVEGIDGLDGAGTVAVSPDGARVYVASADEKAIAVFERAADTGLLTLVAVERQPPGAAPALDGAVDLAVSADSAYLYVVSFFADPVAIFAADPSDGLRFIEDAKAVDGGETITLSPDSLSVYVAGPGRVDVAARNGDTGRLMPVQTIAGPAGDYELESAAVSPDGAAVYALFSEIEVFGIPLSSAPRGFGTAVLDSALGVYRRDLSTGELALVEFERGGLSGAGALTEVESVAVSPDGAHVYVGAPTNGGVAVYARGGDGTLTLVEVRGGGGENLPFQALGGSRTLVVSPDGTEVLVASDHDGGIAISPRDAKTGRLEAPQVARTVLLRRVLLENPNTIAFSPDGSDVYVTSPSLEALSGFARDSDTGLLKASFVLRPVIPGREDLTAGFDAVVSPDGHHVYTTGGIIDDIFLVGGTVAAFARQAGGLSFIEVEQDDVGGVTGLGPDPHVAISPDGQQLYLSSNRGVARFQRDAQSGALTFGGVTAPPPDRRPDRLIVSPDGAHVYVLADDHILAYRADDRGDLSLIQEEPLDPDGALDSAADLVLAPDGAHLYVATGSSGAIVVYTRDSGKGVLRFVETIFDSETVPLRRVLGIAISPDGAHVYAASDVDDAVAVFARNADTGRLTFSTAARNGEGGINGLGGASRVAVSPDGRHVYVGSAGDDALVAFARDRETGGLTFLQVIR